MSDLDFGKASQDEFHLLPMKLHVKASHEVLGRSFTARPLGLPVNHEIGKEALYPWQTSARSSKFGWWIHTCTMQVIYLLIASECFDNLPYAKAHR